MAGSTPGPQTVGFACSTGLPRPVVPPPAVSFALRRPSRPPALAKGQTTQIEAGNASITEAELGLPVYPGAKMNAGSASRVTMPEGTMVSVSMHSSDPPAKVAAFYRDLLRARAQGKQFMDTSTGEGALLLLNDEATRSGVQISIGQADGGTDVQLQVITGKPR